MQTSDGQAAELLARLSAELAPAPDANRLIAVAERGDLRLDAVGALAAEEERIIASDRRSFLLLAARSTERATDEFFAGLAQGEFVALDLLPALADAAGMDAVARRRYRVRPGCQAYPAYMAWLALNAHPAEVVLAAVANFAAWGSYCGTLAQVLRRDHGFGDDACAFLDFFATPVPAVELQAVAAIQAGLDAGCSMGRAAEFGRLLQSYELMFWNTLADPSG
jgi:hypothetical protein